MSSIALKRQNGKNQILLLRINVEVERNIQNIHLDANELLYLVRKAFPACRQIEEYKILSGGALNTTYKVRFENHQLAIRLYLRDKVLCKIEKDIHALIDGKVTTPKLIYADDTYQPYPYAIFEFIDGIPISEASETDQESLSYELGKTLASIHAFKFQDAGLFGEGIKISRPFPEGSSPYYEEAYSVLSNGKYARRRLGDKFSDDLLTFMRDNFDFFPKVEKNICLTHSDFKPVNLLYHAGKIFVLDWEFAHAGIGILDFAILLRHRHQFPLHLDLLAKGYTDFGGDLPKEWIRSALITDFVNILHLLEAPPERPQLFQQLKNTAKTTIDEWASF